MSAQGAARVDVLVLGGGMAGSIAALAARASGARVALARRAPGATALSSGAIGAAPDKWAAAGEPLASRLGTLAAARRIAARGPSHPYARVGAELDRLEEALAFAAAELDEVLCPPGARPLFLATPSGGIRSSALAQRSMVAGDLASIRGPLAVVGLRGHLGFDAALVAGALSSCPALSVRGHRAVELDLFMDEVGAVLRPHELARALEVEGAAEEAGRRLRRALPPGAAVALFPPVLGLSPGARVAERIAESAGLPVAETLADVPSVPGLRLDAALRRRLAAAGVEVLEGAAAIGGAPGSPVSVGGREALAPAWVLATGRFTGGGIVRRGGLEEPLLDLPVHVPGGEGGSRAARPSASLTARDRRSPQPLLAAGVAVDEALRPLGHGGLPAHPRLFAAGAVVSGHGVADGTGLGVAILTGYLAGRRAAAEG
jgi:glycerol-3-phosphate dehydrogenase subunit B